MTWHAETPVLERYVAGTLDDARRWSLEEHLGACDACRTTLASLPTREPSLDARLERIWLDVEVERDSTMARSWPERACTALGIPDHTARLLAATPSLTGAWLLGVACALAAVVAVSRLAYGAGANSAYPIVFAALAPLLPLAGVAAAFGPSVDPTHAIGLASPMRSGTLLLTRAVAVVVTTIPLAVLAGLATPAPRWAAVVWLLPGLALSATALAMTTRMSPSVACGSLMALWIVGVAVATLTMTRPQALFGPPMQVTALVVVVIAGAIMLRDLDRLDQAVGA